MTEETPDGTRPTMLQSYSNLPLRHHNQPSRWTLEFWLWFLGLPLCNLPLLWWIRIYCFSMYRQEEISDAEMGLAILKLAIIGILFLSVMGYVTAKAVQTEDWPRPFAFLAAGFTLMVVSFLELCWFGVLHVRFGLY